jgi:pimeloyl-ACP methyl ester carboxylesterase
LRITVVSGAGSAPPRPARSADHSPRGRWRGRCAGRPLGHRRLLIMAHGFLKAMHWWPQVSMARDAARCFDVLCFDFPGHGKSGGLANISYTRAAAALRCVIDFAATLGYDAIGVVGFSMGAAAAVIAAADGAPVGRRGECGVPRRPAVGVGRRSAAVGSMALVCAPPRHPARCRAASGAGTGRRGGRRGAAPLARGALRARYHRARGGFARALCGCRGAQGLPRAAPIDPCLATGGVATGATLDQCVPRGGVRQLREGRAWR